MNAKDSAALTTAVGNYQNGNPDAAEPVFQQILRRYPGYAQALEGLGLIYAGRGEMRKPLPLLESACVAQPHSSMVFANLGVTYLKLNRNADAVRAFKRSAALQPDAQSEAMLGTALMRMRSYSDAANAFQASTENSPGNRDEAYNWALALFMSGDVGKPIECCTSFPERAPRLKHKPCWRTSGRVKAAPQRRSITTEPRPTWIPAKRI